MNMNVVAGIYEDKDMEKQIEVKELKKYFNTPKGKLHAVDGVSFSIQTGKTMGVVGESGCGKSTLGRVMIRLLDSTSGNIFFEGRDIASVKGRKNLKPLRKNMQIIFQDPFSSLNPLYTIEKTIKESLSLSGEYSNKQLDNETDRLMNLVGIDERLRRAYPHELDGGRRQRVVIARALAPNPKFLVCDEPVSALDVSIQAQVLNLLKDLQKRMGLTYLFITHNLAVVKHISDDICVMYLGQLVEASRSNELFKMPLHPYTQALLSAILSTDISKRHERIMLEGELVSPINPKPGCRFAKRCRFACEKCNKEQILEEVLSNHFVSCCRVKELNNL
jgi:peptide/nickel transport system ATP-binding protein